MAKRKAKKSKKVPPHVHKIGKKLTSPAGTGMHSHAVSGIGKTSADQSGKGHKHKLTTKGPRAKKKARKKRRS